MKKIYLCNNNYNKTIIENKYQKLLDNTYEDDRLGYRYYVIEDGDGGIIQVINHNASIVHKVSDGENMLDFISRGYIVDTDIKVGDLILLKKDSKIKHVVKPLETIETIASQYGISSNDIMITNKLASNRLYIGQMLYI